MSISRHRNKRRKHLRYIAARANVPFGLHARHLLEDTCNMFLSSYSVQIATLYDIWTDKHGFDAAKDLYDKIGRIGVVRTLGRFRPSPVPFFHKERSTGGYRKLCIFSETSLMWQRMAAALVHAQHKPGHHIGDWPKRGGHQQVDAIAQAIQTPWQYVVTADIKHCFQSVEFDAVYELPHLSEAFVRKVLDHRSMTFKQHDVSAKPLRVHEGATYHFERAPTGLLEGSPASNAIFSVLMDDLPSQFNKHISVFVYCDNIILLAPDEIQVLQARDVLVRYLAGHRAGPFECRIEVQSVNQPFEHLGYQIVRRHDGRVSVGLSDRNWKKLNYRIQVDESNLEDVSQWLFASFPQCTMEKVQGYVQLMLDEAYSRASTAMP